KRRMQRGASQYRCLGAWQNARLIGTVEIGLRRAIGGNSDRRYPYIANLAVLSQHRRCGVARQLLSAAEDVARTWGCLQIYLHVMEDNRPARMLYHQLGYRLWRSRRTMWTALGCPRQLLLCKQLEEAGAT
ncbi:MAG: GNAT family N-acetyltransferase, partial [Cyanobacteria bacterium J06648_11]